MNIIQYIQQFTLFIKNLIVCIYNRNAMKCISRDFHKNYFRIIEAKDYNINDNTLCILLVNAGAEFKGPLCKEYWGNHSVYRIYNLP